MTAKMPANGLDRAELIANLADLVRNGGDIARIQAIKVCLSLPEFAVKDDGEQADPFADLDGDDELAKRRRRDRSSAA